MELEMEQTYEEFVTRKAERRSLESTLGTLMSVAEKYQVFLDIPSEPGMYRMGMRKEGDNVYIGFEKYK